MRGTSEDHGDGFFGGYEQTRDSGRCNGTVDGTRRGAFAATMTTRGSLAVVDVYRRGSGELRLAGFRGRIPFTYVRRAGSIAEITTPGNGAATVFISPPGNGDHDLTLITRRTLRSR